MSTGTQINIIFAQATPIAASTIAPTCRVEARGEKKVLAFHVPSSLDFPAAYYARELALGNDTGFFLDGTLKDSLLRHLKNIRREKDRAIITQAVLDDLRAIVDTEAIPEKDYFMNVFADLAHIVFEANPSVAHLGQFFSYGLFQANAGFGTQAVIGRDETLIPLYIALTGGIPPEDAERRDIALAGTFFEEGDASAQAMGFLERVFGGIRDRFAESEDYDRAAHRALVAQGHYWRAQMLFNDRTPEGKLAQSHLLDAHQALKTALTYNPYLNEARDLKIVWEHRFPKALGLENDL